MLCVACCRRVAQSARGVRGRAGRAVGVGAGRALCSRAADASPLRSLLQDASAFGEVAPAAEELQWATQPYAGEPPGLRGGGGGGERAAPADATVLLFPGEDAAHAGMGRQLRDFPAARDIYDLASEVLGWDVWRACAEGGGGGGGGADGAGVGAGAVAVATGLAALERAREERPAAVGAVRACAGFGAGELAALVFAGALSLETALRLAQLRALRMRAAAGAGGRRARALTVWLAPASELPHALLRAREHAAGAAGGVPRPVCQVAAYLHPGCRVVVGDEQAVSWLEREGARFGVVRTAPPAGGAGAGEGGAWPSALTAGARGAMRAALRAAEVRAPRVGVACVSAGGALYAGAAGVRRGLERAVAAPLRWEQTLHALFARPARHAQPRVLALGGARGHTRSLRLVNARAWDRLLHVPV